MKQKSGVSGLRSLILLIGIIGLCFTACPDSGDSGTGRSFTVTFNANGRLEHQS